MRRFFQTLPQRLLWIFAGIGISQVVGIPLIGRIAASGLQLLSDGLQAGSDGAEALSQYIRYDDPEEAHRVMALQIQQGAQVEQIYSYGDGSLGVRWNIERYGGEDIAVTVANDLMIPEGITESTLDALEANWV